MISVLVLANESLFADAITAVLSEEIDLDVVRMSHRELGKGGHYSVIIIVDEEEIEGESLKLKDLVREDLTLILIKVSLESKNIYVFESYQLINPEMDQVLNLLREFSRRNLQRKPGEDLDSQKKMNEARITQTEEYIRNQAYIPATHLFAELQTINSKD
jgi:hypothetical protein